MNEMDEMDDTWKNTIEFSGQNIGVALAKLNKGFRSESGIRYKFKLYLAQNEAHLEQQIAASISQKHGKSISGKIEVSLKAPVNSARIVITEIENENGDDDFDRGDFGGYLPLPPTNPLDEVTLYQVLNKFSPYMAKSYIKMFKPHLSKVFEEDISVKRKLLAAFNVATGGNKTEAIALRSSGKAVIQFREPVLDYVLWRAMKNTENLGPTVLGRRQLFEGTMQAGDEAFKNTWFIVYDPVPIRLSSGNTVMPTVHVNPSQPISVGRCGVLETQFRTLLEKENKLDALSREPVDCPTVYCEAKGVVIGQSSRASVRRGDGTVFQPGQCVPYPAHLRVRRLDLCISLA